MLEEYIVLTPGIVHVKLSIMTYGWFMKIYKLLQLKDYLDSSHKCNPF